MITTTSTSRLLLTTLLCCMGLIACGDDTLGPPQTTAGSIAGVYDLFAVNDTPLPYVSGAFSIHGGTLTLGAAGSAALVFEVHDPTPRFPEVFSGTYTVSGQHLSLDGVDIDGDPMSLTGTVSGSTIQVDSGGGSMDFRLRP